MVAATPSTSPNADSPNTMVVGRLAAHHRFRLVRSYPSDRPDYCPSPNDQSGSAELLLRAISEAQKSFGQDCVLNSPAGPVPQFQSWKHRLRGAEPELHSDPGQCNEAACESAPRSHRGRPQSVRAPLEGDASGKVAVLLGSLDSSATQSRVVHYRP